MIGQLFIDFIAETLVFREENEREKRVWRSFGKFPWTREGVFPLQIEPSHVLGQRAHREIVRVQLFLLPNPIDVLRIPRRRHRLLELLVLPHLDFYLAIRSESYCCTARSPAR